jgi:hypothetical protein
MNKESLGLVCLCVGLAACLKATPPPVKEDAAVGGAGGGSNDGPMDTGGSDGGDALVADRTPTDGPPPAAAANVYFASLYDSIFKVRCAPCHVTQMPRSGMFDLGDVTIALASLTTGTTGCASATPKERVVPGKPDDSYLIKKLTGAPGICGLRMPRGCVEAGDAGPPPDAAVVADASPDAAVDTADARVSSDGRADATTADARSDTQPDATPDASPDAPPDAGPPPVCLAPDSLDAIKAWILTGAKVGGLLVNDGANAPNWSLQGNLQVGPMGAHPWTDYAKTYVAAVDTPASGLVGKSWVRLPAASKNFKNSPQAVLTLRAPADIYLVVDDRWGPSLPWLAGWTDTTWNFTIWESDTRPALPFSLYKKSAPAGDLELPAIGANNAYDYFIVID